MAIALNGTSQYLTVPVSSNFEFGTGDFTVAFKVFVRNFNTGSRYASIALGRGANGASSSGSNFVSCGWQIFLYNGTDLYFVRVDGVAADIVIQRSATLNTNTWLDVVMTRISGVSRIYLNASQVGSTATLTASLDRVASGGSQSLHIGYSLSGNSTENAVSGQSYYASYANANFAELAIWKAGLADAEITALSKGFTPHQIRPQSLSFYLPLVSTIQDLQGGLAITNNNDATVATHPRIYT